MPTETLVRILYEGLLEVPLLDVHTHLDAAHLSARGLHDILLYHMVISDLVTAGCPSRARVSEDPDETETRARIVEAVPYLHHIRNTSCAWGLRIILHDLYGWRDPVTPDNWERLDGLVRECHADPDWPRAIMGKAGIKRAVTELWRGRDGAADELLQYSLEWAMFTRTQWGLNDIPLLELERTWGETEPGPPLAVTLGETRPNTEHPVRTVDDVRAAVSHYVSVIPYDRVISTAQHISTDIDYRPVSDEEMAQALSRRECATVHDRDVYASYIFEAFLTDLELHGDEIVYQFSLGAEPLPYETGSKLGQGMLFQLASIIAQHPRLRFHAYLSSEYGNQSLCTLARELPNLVPVGFWWHNFFPGIMRKVMGDRLDMVASNKQIGFFSDAYCLEWQYAKAVLVRKQLATVLAARVESGQYTLDDALSVARAILYEAPQSLLGVEPSAALV